MEGRNQGCPLGTELNPDLLFKPRTIHCSFLRTARRQGEPKRYPPGRGTPPLIERPLISKQSSGRESDDAPRLAACAAPAIATGRINPLARVAAGVSRSAAALFGAPGGCRLTAHVTPSVRAGGHARPDPALPSRRGRRRGFAADHQPISIAHDPTRWTRPARPVGKQNGAAITQGIDQ
jgi:hypothetical protein